MAFSSNHAEITHFCQLPAPWGSIELSACDGKLWQVAFSLEPTNTAFHTPDVLSPWAELIEQTLDTSQSLNEETVCEIFSLPRMQSLSVFSQKVLRELTKIPAGTFKTYQELATATGNPKATRAVARVLASNPFVILLPCQRVASKESLTRFDTSIPTSFAPKAFGGREDFIEIGMWLRINDLANAM